MQLLTFSSENQLDKKYVKFECEDCDEELMYEGLVKKLSDDDDDESQTEVNIITISDIRPSPRLKKI